MQQHLDGSWGKVGGRDAADAAAAEEAHAELPLGLMGDGGWIDALGSVGSIGGQRRFRADVAAQHVADSALLGLSLVSSSKCRNSQRRRLQGMILRCRQDEAARLFFGNNLRRLLSG